LRGDQTFQSRARIKEARGAGGRLIMSERDDIIAANPLEPFLRQRGYDLRPAGKNWIPRYSRIRR
jgi:hypothetical protein